MSRVNVSSPQSFPCPRFNNIRTTLSIAETIFTAFEPHKLRQCKIVRLHSNLVLSYLFRVGVALIVWLCSTSSRPPAVCLRSYRITCIWIVVAHYLLCRRCCVMLNYLCLLRISSIFTCYFFVVNYPPSFFI